MTQEPVRAGRHLQGPSRILSRRAMVCDSAWPPERVGPARLPPGQQCSGRVRAQVHRAGQCPAKYQDCPTIAAANCSPFNPTAT
jgi:hypothetical protein